ncbi:hypothetical protein GQ600_27413 [Phytophthora cactorum]|nr:hypothetical protein GQ600_27413 [Phytophthora cactorum]
MLDPKYCPDPRINVASDSAFPYSMELTGSILTPLKDGYIERILPALRISARTHHNAITSVRQAAEWGMGSMQKVYIRLNLPLPYEPKFRGFTHRLHLPHVQISRAHGRDLAYPHLFQWRDGGCVYCALAFDGHTCNVGLSF